MADPDRLNHLRGLEAHLRSRLLGQDHVLSRLAGLFCRGELAVTAPGRPRGSAFLTGPTGTGKTEAFSQAVEFALGSGRLAVVELSEFQSPTAAAKLIGAGPSDEGYLGRLLDRHPSGGILFDELEKAHPGVHDLFLQIVGQGRVTLATGRTITFEKHYLGFGSNLGGAEAMRMAHLRFASVEQAILRRVAQELRPEFLARLDEVLVFAPLAPDTQREICRLVVRAETDRLRGLGHDLQVSREALEFLVREGFHPQLGARPLRRAVERHLQDAVVRKLFTAGGAGGSIGVDYGRGRLEIQN